MWLNKCINLCTHHLDPWTIEERERRHNTYFPEIFLSPLNCGPLPPKSAFDVLDPWNQSSDRDPYCNSECLLDKDHDGPCKCYYHGEWTSLVKIWK